MNSITTTVPLAIPPGSWVPAIDATGELLGRALRTVHARRGRGHDYGPLSEKAVICGEFGITARQFNGIHATLASIYGSIRTNARNHARDLKAKLSDKQAELRKLIARMEKIKAAERAEALKHRLPLAERKPITKATAKLIEGREPLRLKIESGKRRIRNLAKRLQAAEAQAARKIPKVVFGSKALLRERASIHPNDTQAIDAWRRRWEAARGGSIFVKGGMDETLGNKSCKAELMGDGTVTLTLRLSPALEAAYGKMVTISGCRIPDAYMKTLGEVLSRNARSRPGLCLAITWRLSRTGAPGRDRASEWLAYATIEEGVRDADFEESFHASGGCIGLDVNADRLALARIDASGNPVARISIPIRLRGLSSGQREAVIGDAVRQALDWVESHGCPLAIEHLDFQSKKLELARARKSTASKAERGRLRMLHALAYAAVVEGVSRRAARKGIALARVNPMFTSVIGRKNLAGRYAMSVHESAAVAIARRACGFSERMRPDARPASPDASSRGAEQPRLGALAHWLGGSSKPGTASRALRRAWAMRSPARRSLRSRAVATPPRADARSGCPPPSRRTPRQARCSA